jgi:hypothetical protein
MRKERYEVNVEAMVELKMSAEEMAHLRSASGNKDISVTLSWRQLNGKLKTIEMPMAKVYAYGVGF